MDNQKTRDTLLGIATLWKERDSQDPLHHRFRLSQFSYSPMKAYTC